MSKFRLFEKDIMFSEAQDRFIELAQLIPVLKKQARAHFQCIYEDEWADIDDVLDEYNTVVTLVISHLLKDRLYGYLINADIYDVSEEMMIEKCWATSAADEAYNIVAEAYNDIQETYEGEVEYRKLRKAGRGRVVGGGFGFSGAIKGMATAGAMNTATGLGHSIVNAFGNLKSSIAADEAKDALYESKKTYRLLEEGVANSVVATVQEFVGFINDYKESEGEEIWFDGSPFDVKRAETLLVNAVRFKEKREELLIKAFVFCPYHPDILEAIFVAFVSERSNIVEISELLKIDISDIFERVIQTMYPDKVNANDGDEEDEEDDEEEEDDADEDSMNDGSGYSESELVEVRNRIIAFMVEFKIKESKTLSRLEEHLIYAMAEAYDDLEFDKKDELISKIINCEVSDEIKKKCIRDNEIWELFTRYDIVIPEEEKMLLLFKKYEEIRYIPNISHDRIIELLDDVIHAINFNDESGSISYEVKEAIFECLTGILLEKLKSKSDILELKDDLSSDIAEKVMEIIQQANIDFLTTSLKYKRPHEDLCASQLEYAVLSSEEIPFIIYDERPLMYPGKYGFCMTDKRFFGRSENGGGKYEFPINEIVGFEKKGFFSNHFIIHTKKGSKEINAENLSSVGGFVDCLNEILAVLPNNDEKIKSREKTLEKEMAKMSVACIEEHSWLIQYLGMEEKVEKLREKVAEYSKPRASSKTTAPTVSENKEESEPVNKQEEPVSTDKTSSEPNPFVNLPKMSDVEVGNTLLALQGQHGGTGFNMIHSPEFAVKLSKAMKAYAKLSFDERALLMEDSTVFGSAKEGFVLTDKRVHIKRSFTPVVNVLIGEITNVFCERKGSLTYTYICVNNQNHELSYTSSHLNAESNARFIAALIESLKNAKPSNENMWVCSCGNTNLGKFCTKCGRAKNQ